MTQATKDMLDLAESVGVLMSRNSERDTIEGRLVAFTGRDLAAYTKLVKSSDLEKILRCRYPVSTEISQKGWGWDTSRLDEVIEDLKKESSIAVQKVTRGPRGNICEACETISHCSSKGCIPIKEIKT